MKLAERLAAVAPSATLALTQKAQEMKAAGRDVVSLTAGEPDAAPAPHIIEAIHKALADGYTRYTPVPGLPEVRARIAAHHSHGDRQYAAEQVVVSTGAKQTIFNAALALLNPGDEAVILAPYWVSYPAMVQIAEGTPKVVTTRAEDDFAVDPELLEAAMGPRTRLMLLNSPQNPSGAVYDEAAMRGIAEVLRRHPDVVVIADEIYERFTYDGARFVSLLDVAPDLVDRTLVVNGCSKAYSMTGLRIGWGLGPKPLMKAIAKLQGQSTSNASAPMQLAALAAIEGDQAPVQAMLTSFEARRALVLERLGAMAGVSCRPPRGAFYAFPHIAPLLSRRLPDGAPVGDVGGLCQYLLERYSVVVVPGTPFGAPEHFRLSYATDTETLDRGLTRMAEAFERLA